MDPLVLLYRLQVWKFAKDYRRLCTGCGAFFNGSSACPICGSGKTVENSLENYLHL